MVCQCCTVDRPVKVATNGALSKLTMCCLSYRHIFIILLVFAYVSAALAWVFVHESIYALAWNSVYTLLVVIATLGLVLSHTYLMAALPVAFAVDVVIATVVAILLGVTGDAASIGVSSLLDATTAAYIFGGFAGLQLVLTIVLGKIMEDMRHAVLPYRRASSVSSGVQPEPVIHRV